MTLKTPAGEERIATKTVIWAAGVKGPDVLGDLDLELSRSNQLVVLPTLYVTVFGGRPDEAPPARSAARARASARHAAARARAR